ncbi:MAG: tyrosine--tRNA ligase [Euryarchaeota archaeon]|nr:tyrosine--tRNA ligase [Euryarchaeota archaeon]MED5486447.1 tyrosine--tRNA ligase [Candidatus Thermoplasmatota archaeon]|tara:strand:+ start:2445 stop:3509 length:1065 start_codon:yes stop_codon:yes gene_type:complete
MDSKKRLSLITGAAQEVVGIEHLESRIADGGTIRAYVGFEPSGKAHIGWKVIATNLRRMLDADVNVLIFLADWHAWVNDKFGGDMEKIQTTAKYMEDVFRTLLNHPEEGDGPGQLRFAYASEIMDSGEYWARVLRCSKNMSLARVRRTFSIMGRDEESGDGDLSKFYYPAMQAADIFEMEIDLAIGGMDQRKAHMYMREVADHWGWPKATCIHTPIISGLKSAGSRMDSFDHKMSKSDPSGAILLHDSPEKMRKKMRKAYLDVEKDDSPIYELLEHIILPEQGQITVTPKPEYGEPSTYESLEGFIGAVKSGEIHPLDAKFAVADALSTGLQSLNAYFESNSDVLNAVNEFTSQ